MVADAGLGEDHDRYERQPEAERDQQRRAAQAGDVVGMDGDLREPDQAAGEHCQAADERGIIIVDPAYRDGVLQDLEATRTLSQARKCIVGIEGVRRG